MKHFLLLTFPYYVFWTIFLSNLHFSLEAMIFKTQMYLSKLASQMVTSTAPENLVGKPYEIHHQNFDFCSPQTLIWYTRLIFLGGVN
jgi:hypothetical protein